MKRIEAQAWWKNNPVTLSSWFYMRPTFHLDSPRTRDREIKRGKGERRVGVCAFTLPVLPPLSIFVSSFCAHSTHTLAVQWIFNLDLISCAPDETNTDSLFTFVKAPAAAVLVPHTPCVHTNTHSHTHNLWIGGLAPAGAYRKSRLCTKWPWLHRAALCRALLLFLLTHIHQRTHTVCVMFHKTQQHCCTLALVTSIITQHLLSTTGLKRNQQIKTLKKLYLNICMKSTVSTEGQCVQLLPQCHST